MNRNPVILIYSGSDADDQELCRMIRTRFPEVTVLTASSDTEVEERLPQADILFAWTFPVKFLAFAKNLTWFQVMGAGVDRLAAGPQLPAELMITNLKGVFGSSMGEYALAYMLAHTQNIKGVLQNQADRRWAPFNPGRLAGQTVGVAGLGSIGMDVVRRCGALGMRVIGMKRSPGPVDGVAKVFTTAEIDQFLPECDFLVLVLPHTPETAGLLTSERLRSMKRHCFVVNMGRGSIAGEADMVEALREGWIGGAALDVFPTEPLPPESPLWSLPNVYITPHIAGTNRPDELAPVFLENLGRYMRGEPLRHRVDLRRGY